MANLNAEYQEAKVKSLEMLELELELNNTRKQLLQSQMMLVENIIAQLQKDIEQEKKKEVEG